MMLKEEKRHHRKDSKQNCVNYEESKREIKRERKIKICRSRCGRSKGGTGTFPTPEVTG